MFRSSYYSSISFAQWLSHLPPELVKAHFNFTDDAIKAFPKDDTAVVG
jgi:oxalate decarboxylase